MQPRFSRRAGLATLAIMACALMAWAVAAQQWSLERRSTDPGAGALTGGGFELTGAIGQPAPLEMTGGDYAMRGGILFTNPDGNSSANPRWLVPPSK